MSERRHWPHGPPHFVRDRGVYMVTGSTLGKELFFGSRKRLRFFQDRLLEYADFYGWRIQAWAVLANHYHFVAVSPEGGGESLKNFIKRLHSETAKFVNDLDDAKGRKVWFQYWDSHITHDSSHYARLHYVNTNAVKHGLVLNATDYEWCSARWFEGNTERSFQKMVESFPVDRLNVVDDF